MEYMLNETIDLVVLHATLSTIYPYKAESAMPQFPETQCCVSR